MHTHQNASVSRQATLHAQLDQTREASMADEGGVAAVLMDVDDDGERRILKRAYWDTRWRSPRTRLALRLAAAGVCLLVLGICVRRMATPELRRLF
jgi:hypothetical protein